MFVKFRFTGQGMSLGVSLRFQSQTALLVQYKSIMEFTSNINWKPMLKSEASKLKTYWNIFIEKSNKENVSSPSVKEKHECFKSRNGKQP